MPRSDIVRSNKPGLFIPRNAPSIRQQQDDGWTGRSDTISYRPTPGGLVPKTTYVPPISLANAVRHLTYHIWPTKHTSVWQWNLQQLAQRWTLFNGRKLLGIVYDELSHSPETVLEYCRELGMHWDFVYSTPNDSIRGELATWQPRMEWLLPELSTRHDVVFNAHAKGVKYEDENTVRPWTQLMYEACLDNWGKVQDLLERSACAGTIRVRGGTDGFRYAGTFFWFRLNAVRGGRWKDIHPGAWGVEDWPARHFTTKASSCIFADDDTLSTNESINLVFDRWRTQTTEKERILMHPEARQFVTQFRTAQQLTVIEIGSRNINGTIRDLFPNAKWIGLDRMPGPLVDVLVDAVDYVPPDKVDMVICCEVLEHAENWEQVLRKGVSWLKPGGWMIITCAGFGRPPHSVIVEGTPGPEEHYANLTCQQIEDVLRANGMKIQQSHYLGTTFDVQVAAVNPP